MKVIENPGITRESTPLSRLDGVFSSLKFGKAFSQDMDSQQGVIEALENILDNNYVMLRNVTLEGLEIPIPLVLVGPAGLRVFYPSASRGVFRAKGDVWEKLDESKQVFRSVAPNLLTRAQLMAQAVSAYLLSRAGEQLEVEPVLFFTDPGTHVDTVRPLVRVVHADGIEHFIATLIQGRRMLDNEKVDQMVDLLSKPMYAGADVEDQDSAKDAFSFLDEQREARKRALEDRIPRGERIVAALNRISFTRRQWVFIILMIVINISLLVALVLYILISV